MRNSYSILLFTCLLSSGVFAQTVAPSAAPTAAGQPVTAVPPAPVTASNQAAGMVIGAPSRVGQFLPQGTSVRLRTLSPLSSSDNKTGDRFDLEVSEDVLLNGRVVIPRGSPGRGEITLVKKKGMWGKSGKLETRVLSVRANGMDIPLRGTVLDKGDTGTAGVVGAILVLPVAGFFVTGTSAVLPQGTGFTGLTESDLPVTFADQVPVQPAAVVIGPATPSAVVTAAAGPAKAVANTPSGFCYDVPNGYVGNGTVDKPVITTFTPACSTVGRR